MDFLRQFFAILRVNLSSVTARLGAVLTIIIGVACAVGALVSMLAMGIGAHRQAMADARPDRMQLVTAGTRGFQSNISRDEVTAVLDLPFIRKGVDGAPIVVLEAFVPVEGRRRVTGNRIYFPLLGVTPNITEYAPEIHFTEGRMFHRGLYELAASNPCVRQFVGFEMGAHRPIHGVDWTVVGHFDQGTGQQCVVFADVDTILSLFKRSSYNMIAAMLQSAQDDPRFRRAVEANPTLHLDVRSEPEGIEDAFKPLNALLNFASLFVGTIMAAGATLGAMNSLYAIVDARRQEFATLRSLGFGGAAIASSIVCESMLLAVPGALLGAALAWLFFNGLSASPFGFSFQLVVTPPLALLGIVWALGMGLLGGILPSIRAARVPLTTALRVN